MRQQQFLIISIILIVLIIIIIPSVVLIICGNMEEPDQIDLKWGIVQSVENVTPTGLTNIPTCKELSSLIIQRKKLSIN